jgi:hypothetical protein
VYVSFRHFIDLVMAAETSMIEDAIAESIYSGCGVKVVRSRRFGLMSAKVDENVPHMELHEYLVD